MNFMSTIIALLSFANFSTSFGVILSSCSEIRIETSLVFCLLASPACPAIVDFFFIDFFSSDFLAVAFWAAFWVLLLFPVFFPLLFISQPLPARRCECESLRQRK